MSALQKIASGITQIPQQDLREVEGMNAFFIIPTNWRKRGGELFMDAPAAREAAGRARRDRARDGPAGRVARVGLRDVLFGRKQLKDAAGERLFAISTARITLETELDLRSAGAAGVCFKSLSAGEFVRAENELQQLLDAVAVESGSKISRQTDELGFEWLIVARRRLRGSRHDRAPGRLRAPVAGLRAPAARRGLPVRAQGLRRRPRLLDLRLQAGRLLAVRRRRATARSATTPRSWS